jgi:hypothetical protein
MDCRGPEKGARDLAFSLIFARAVPIRAKTAQLGPIEDDRRLGKRSLAGPEIDRLLARRGDATTARLSTSFSILPLCPDVIDRKASRCQTVDSTIRKRD